jgi:cell wall-associated NlpC family hydrolase
MHPKVALYDYAVSTLWRPYVYGGDDFNGIDCSGLVLELLKAVGVWPNKEDTTANGLYNHFHRYRVDDPCFGALSFYGKPGAISHVGFCLNNQMMIEAGGGDSSTKTPDDAARKNAWVRMRPIRFRSDLVGFVMPPYPWRG